MRGGIKLKKLRPKLSIFCPNSKIPYAYKKNKELDLIYVLDLIYNVLDLR